MYFLGHMAWAYVLAMTVWTLIPSVRKSGKIIIPIILLLGILPDSDILLNSIGIAHRTVTHSLIFWTILFTPIFIILQLKSIPYFVAAIQHMAFGDILIGKVMLIWPLNTTNIGLNYAMTSPPDIALETTGLLLAAAILIYSKDIKRTLSKQKQNILMALPLTAIIISGLFFAAYWQSINTFAAYILTSKLLILLALGHLILIGFLATSTIQGLRAKGLNQPVHQSFEQQPNPPYA